MLRALRILSVVLLVAVGGFFTVLGLHDVVLANRSQERLIGGALAVVGLASLMGVGLLVRRHRGWGTWLLASVGALGGATLFAVQASFRSDGRNWLWGVLVVLPPACVAVLAASDKERRERKPALNDLDVGSDRRAMIAAVLATAATIVAACIPLLGGAFRPV